MKYLYSEPLANQLKLQLKKQSEELVSRGIEPHLGVVLVGNHEESLKYIAIKSKVAKELGITVSLYHVEADSDYAQVEELVTFLNNDEEVHGIIIQLPLPEQFTPEQTTSLLGLIDPMKDVDGLEGAWEKQSHVARTVADLQASHGSFLPPMVLSVLSLLDFYDTDLSEKSVALIGKGRLVGHPLEVYLKKIGINVVSTDEETPDILSIVKQADIVISGTGEPDLVTYQWVKPGAIVIDCAQDIHEDSVIQVAEALAPAKGGVGPLTVVWLLHNTIQATINHERNL